MSTNTNDGGPAFPSNLTNYKCKQSLAEDLFLFDGDAPGMSLRDYFAAKATEEDVQHWIGMQYPSREAAKFAYADAMIAARNQTMK